MSLLTDLKSAFKRGDCATARSIVSRMNVAAKTPREREQIYRLQNAVRRCKVRGVAGVKRAKVSKRTKAAREKARANWGSAAWKKEMRRIGWKVR